MRSMTPIDPAQVSLEDIRRKLETGTLNSIRGLLTDAAIEEACRTVGLVYRNRLITPKVTVLHMILAALWPEASFAAGWQVVWDFMTSRLPEAAGRSPNSGSVAKARARLPEKLWMTLFETLSARAQEMAGSLDVWRGHRVLLLDGTCVSMEDVPELFRAFGTCTGCHGKGRYPLARVVTVASANSMTIRSYAVGRYQQSENELAESLLQNLGPGHLLVADRRFAGAARYAGYLARGLEFLTRMHQCVKVSRLRRIRSYGKDDFVTDLVIPPSYRRKDPTLPQWVRVRLIRARVKTRGKSEVIWLVTSLLDARRYPAAEVVELYGKRWRIEELFREVKVEMSADVLRSRSASGVRKELAARLMTVNLVRMIALRAASEHHVEPLRISFRCTVRAVIDFAPSMATAPPWKVLDIYRAMLKEIASHLVPERPGRQEPRARRRELQGYPTLRTTRRLWRLHHAA
jgi:hypothetical protein